MVSEKLILVLFLVSKLYAVEEDNANTASTSDAVSSTLKSTEATDSIQTSSETTDATASSSTLQTTDAPSTTLTTDVTNLTTLHPVTKTSVEPRSTTGPIEVPKFIVKDDNLACIILEGELEVSINYYIEKKVSDEKFKIGPSVNVSGSCDAQEQFLLLSWFPVTGVPFSLNFSFSQLPAAPSSHDIVVDSIILDYILSTTAFPGATENGSRSVSVKGEFFKMPTASHFTCLAPQVIILNDTGTLTASLTVSSLKVEAFRNSTSEEFIGTAYDCVIIPTTSNAIPIAVGVSFAILIVLAVVAFLIGNRRRQQGYQTI